MHGDGVPYRVLAEESDCLAGLEAEFADEGGGEVGRGVFDLLPVEGFLGDGVVVAAEGVGGVAVDGGVGWVFEEPLPGCEVAGDFEQLETRLFFKDGRAELLTVYVLL